MWQDADPLGQALPGKLGGGTGYWAPTARLASPRLYHGEEEEEAPQPVWHADEKHDQLVGSRRLPNRPGEHTNDPQALHSMHTGHTHGLLRLRLLSPGK